MAVLGCAGYDYVVLDDGHGVHSFEALDTLILTACASERKEGAMIHPRDNSFYTRGETAIGLYEIMQWRQPLAVAQERELNMLAWNHFVPASDVGLKKQAEQFGREQHVKVRLDFIAHLQLPSKLTAELQTHSGHDIVLFRDLEAALHQHSNHTLSDLCDSLATKHSRWWDFARQAEVIDGEWRVIPWFYVSGCITYREDYFTHIGESAPDSYDEYVKNLYHECMELKCWRGMTPAITASSSRARARGCAMPSASTKLPDRGRLSWHSGSITRFRPRDRCVAMG